MLPFFLFIKMHNNFVSIYKNHIAIIGAGISGLTLGIVLKKEKIPCVIFEKFSSISEYGAGISISRNGQKVLKELKVLDELKLVSGNPKKANFIYANNEITSLDIDHITTSRKALHKVLLEKYLSANGEINFNFELADIDINNKLLSFSNNKNFNVGHIASCDGIKSICRKSVLENKSKPSYSGYSVWRSIVNEKQNEVEFHLGPGFHVVTYPINSSKTSFVAAFKTHKASKESWKSKGIGAPSYLFSVLVIITAIFETFKGIPFALVSAVGAFFVWTAISTVVYSRENKFLGRLIPGLIMWGIGALLIRLGGMTGITVFDFYMYLPLWSSILGATFFPEHQASNPFGPPKDPKI